MDVVVAVALTVVVLPPSIVVQGPPGQSVDNQSQLGNKTLLIYICTSTHARTCLWARKSKKVSGSESGDIVREEGRGNVHAMQKRRAVCTCKAEQMSFIVSSV